MFNEHEVRAAAGLTMVIGAVAFSYAYFDQYYLPLRIVTAVLFAEFLIRLTVGSPVQPDGRRRTRADARAAAGMGLREAQAIRVDAGTGDVVVDGGAHQRRRPRHVPRTICLTCLSLMWMESVLGLCLGCKVYALLVRRGWTAKDPAVDVCAHGECERATGPAEA